VGAAIRMLGAGFFQEMTSGRRVSRLKTYDQTVLRCRCLTAAMSA
jgi:hypothetical protein